MDLADYPSLPGNDDSTPVPAVNNVTQIKQKLSVFSSFPPNRDGLGGLFDTNALVVHNQGTTPSIKRNPEHSPDDSMLRKKPVVSDGDVNMGDLSVSEDEKEDDKEAN